MNMENKYNFIIPQGVKKEIGETFKSTKTKHPEAIILFRDRDFYEVYQDDAVVASRILGITLYKGADNADGWDNLCRFPHHALDMYLPKLIRAGLRVAICGD